MSTLIDLAAVRDERTSRVEGTARCLSCKHEWEACTQAMQDWLDCPKCGVKFGRIIHHVGKPGELHWACECGNDLFYIQPDKIYCPACGSTQRGF